MLKVKGMVTIDTKAGIDSWRSSQSIPRTELHISAPNKHRMGTEAKGGTAETTGAKGMANKKQAPVTNGARPVLAPSATPAVDSAKVATVDTPSMEPTNAAMAS